MHDDNEPSTTMIAIIATTTPAVLPMIGSLDAINTIGASEAAISSIVNRPEATNVNPP